MHTVAAWQIGATRHHYEITHGILYVTSMVTFMSVMVATIAFKCFVLLNRPFQVVERSPVLVSVRQHLEDCYFLLVLHSTLE